MIKRLFDIARSSVNHWRRNGEPEADLGGEAFAFSGTGYETPDEVLFDPAPDPLAPYYANLEIPSGSSLEEAKSAWKRLMKKYHPDLHSSDPARRETGEELTRRLTEAYRAIEKELERKAHTY